MGVFAGGRFQVRLFRRTVLAVRRLGASTVYTSTTFLFRVVLVAHGGSLAGVKSEL